RACRSPSQMTWNIHRRTTRILDGIGAGCGLLGVSLGRQQGTEDDEGPKSRTRSADFQTRVGKRAGEDIPLQYLPAAPQNWRKRRSTMENHNLAEEKTPLDMPSTKFTLELKGIFSPS